MHYLALEKYTSQQGRGGKNMTNTSKRSFYTTSPWQQAYFDDLISWHWYLTSWHSYSFRSVSYLRCISFYFFEKGFCYRWSAMVYIVSSRYTYNIGSRYSMKTYPICDSPLYRSELASLRYRNRAEINVLMCKQKASSIRYGFRAGAKGIHCTFPYEPTKVLLT